MSIIKMINMARQTHGDLDDLHTYICSASKTKDGTLIGTNNILSKMHVMEMQTVKKYTIKQISVNVHTWLYLLLRTVRIALTNCI